MLAIVSLTFPFFALVLCGYLAARRGLLAAAAIPGLNSFVLYFALPCLLYRFGAATPLARLLDWRVAGLYLLCALLMVGLAVLLTAGRPRDWNNGAFGALVAAFPNTGFMGVPLLLALLGPQSSGPVIVTIAIDMVFTSSLCIGLSRLGSGHSGAAAGAALRGILVNPMPWAITLGALASAAQLALPAPLMRCVSLLADAASPVALFTIGAVLARAGLNGAAPPPGRLLPVALLKLLVHPLLVLALGYGAGLAGLAPAPAALHTLVLVACLPSASNVLMLAERFGADSARIAGIIMVTTALSFVTFSLAVALLPG